MIILRDLLRGIKGDDGEFLAQVVGEGAPPRAAIVISPNLRRILLGETADATSLIHELGHAWLDILRHAAREPSAAELARQDWASVRDWLGASEDGPLTPAQHEQWAKAWERYHAEGIAPRPELFPVLEALRAVDYPAARPPPGDPAEGPRGEGPDAGLRGRVARAARHRAAHPGKALARESAPVPEKRAPLRAHRKSEPAPVR